MAKMITEIIGGESYEYVPLGDYVVRARGICGGRPTFKYTRILVAGTLDRVDAGETIDSISKSYRGRVTKDAILEALKIRSNKNNKKSLKRAAA